jgi:hypothetical protein
MPSEDDQRPSNVSYEGFNVTFPVAVPSPNVVKSTDDTDVAADLNPQKNSGTSSKEDNTAVRNDALRIASRVNNVITTQNAGILSGLYLVKGEVINSGKNVKVVYRWDKKSNAVRPVVRGLMMQ